METYLEYIEKNKQALLEQIKDKEYFIVNNIPNRARIEELGLKFYSPTTIDPEQWSVFLLNKQARSKPSKDYQVSGAGNDSKATHYITNDYRLESI